MPARAFKKGAGQRDFIAQVQDLLRGGRASEALSLAHREMKTVAEADETLAEIALDLAPDDLELVDWSDLRARLCSFARRKTRITAVQIDFANPQESGATPNDDGALDPVLETTYFTDSANLAFSKSEREHLNALYADEGAPWQGNFEDIDELLEVRGLGVLYGAIRQRADKRGRESAAGDCFTIAAAICQILLHMRVKLTIEADKLPCALAVMVGSNQDYPQIEAPVMTFPEAVLLLNPEPEPEPEGEIIEEEVAPEPEPELHPSGTSLRKRFIDPASIVLEELPPPRWWRSLFLKPA